MNLSRDVVFDDVSWLNHLRINIQSSESGIPKWKFSPSNSQNYWWSTPLSRSWSSSQRFCRRLEISNYRTKNLFETTPKAVDPALQSWLIYCRNSHRFFFCSERFSRQWMAGYPIGYRDVHGYRTRADFHCKRISSSWWDEKTTSQALNRFPSKMCWLWIETHCGISRFFLHFLRCFFEAFIFDFFLGKWAHDSWKIVELWFRKLSYRRFMA